MTVLENQRRTLLQATYTPLEAPPGQDDDGGYEPGDKKHGYRAWEKRSYVALVAPTVEELQTVAEADAEGADQLAVRQALHAITASDDLVARGETGRAVNRFVDVDPGAIEQVLSAVLELRARRLEEHAEQLEEPPEEDEPPAPRAAQARAEDGKLEPPPGPGWQRVETRVHEHVYQRTLEDLPANPDTDPDDPTPQSSRTEFVVVSPAPRPLLAPAPRRPAARDTQADLTTARHLLSAQQAAVKSMRSRFQVEPVGLLHLERLGFTPAGIERGELVYSLPLAPGEEVALTYREWSNTAEEFQKIVTDFLETYSEEGVTEKSELSQATSSQTQHAMGFNAGVTASGQFGAVNIAATTGFNLSEASTKSEQSSRNQSAQVTRKASSRAKQEHKMSFTTSTASGTEQTTSRTIKNPHDDAVVRVDYYQLVRKWNVDLFRYGVRLTYDLAIPEPGADIMSKINELEQLSGVLDVPFGDPNATVDWAKFTLTPGDLTRADFATKAAQYGAAVNAPPDATKSVIASWNRSWNSYESSWNADAFSLPLKIDEGYTVASGVIAQTHVNWPGHGYPENVYEADWVEPPAGAHGTVAVIGRSRNNASMEVVAQLDLTLNAEAFAAWQLTAWATIRDAANAQYYEQRQSIKDRISQLEQELAGEDPLSLRKIEREEVMKGVLRWLFGPNFRFRPGNLPASLYDPTTAAVADAQSWATMLLQGEVIKFIHQAIEWENMVYVLYPYFWSPPGSWKAKENVRHPDLLHRAFLKAGSARVVLTIRPGYEQDFMAIVESGVAGGLPGNHPYMKIAEELQAYANTTYPGMKPANTPSARPLLTYRQRQAWDEMVAIIAALDAYRDANGGVYPTTAQGIAAAAAALPAGAPALATDDPWGNAYDYTSPGEYAAYDLVSLGADGAVGGEGEDADIASWAEASLVGSWHEYTPTSALDIAYADPLPAA
jgi:type II secretion system protein G